MTNIIEQVRIYIFVMCGRDNVMLVAEVQTSAMNHCGEFNGSREAQFGF